MGDDRCVRLCAAHEEVHLQIVVPACLADKLACGFAVIDSEPLKIVIDATSSGYTGYELSELLRSESIECEFADGEFVVLMASPNNTERDFSRLAGAFDEISPKTSLVKEEFIFKPAVQKMTVREAVFAAKEEIGVDSAAGRICAETSISCPPAVPVAVCGELITEDTVALLKRYGVEKIKVVK